MQTVKAENRAAFLGHKRQVLPAWGKALAQNAKRVAPGSVACAVVGGLAYAMALLEQELFGAVWLEELVLAIIIGACVRTFAPLRPEVSFGITFCTKQVLDVAVMLLGCAVSTQVLLSAGWGLPVGIACFVALAILGSYALGRLFGLPRRLALLIACGNAICGNSAIAAVAPVIRAKGEDVAAAISFTALLGVALVLVLPLFVVLLPMQPMHYGALAGLTVYAVPQVLAATVFFGPTAVQFGTLIKLTRVLMLGPVVMVLAVLGHHMQRTPKGQNKVKGQATAPTKTGLALGQVMPWFIVGFLGLAALRSLQLIPPACVLAATQASTVLTVLAMAGLGLSTNLRAVAQCGVRAGVVVVLSLGMLVVASFGFMAVFGL